MRTSLDDEGKKSLALAMLAENYGKTFSDGLLDIWLELLAPYTAAEVQRAAMAVIKSYEYKTLPPFAVLQKALDEADGNTPESFELQAIAEWGVLMAEIERNGSYRLPEKMHPTTAYVLRIMGGWQAACTWTESALDFKRKEFVAFWRDAHGKVGAMTMGAAGVARAIEGEARGALHVGAGISRLLEGAPQ